jgi:autotransporter-associated beta strand protein
VINLASTTFGVGIEANGAGPLVLSSALTATGVGSKTLTLSGSNTGSNSIGAIVNNSVTNTTAVTKTGTGTWVLSGTNSYTGATNVSAGTLRVNGSTHSSSNFTVASGATLAGSGTVAGQVSVSGNVAPGNGTSAIGVLNTGSTTWNGGTNLFQFDLAATAGSSDKLAIAGNFAKTGSTFKFDFMGSAPATFGNVYDLVTWTGLNEFAADDFTFQGLNGSFNTGSFSITGSTLQFTAVPEASNLLIGGLLGLGMMSRRRKQA